LRLKYPTRTKCKSKSSKKVTFADKPILIPRSLFISSRSDDLVKPQPSGVLRFGSFSVQIQDDLVHSDSVILHDHVFGSSRDRPVVHGDVLGSVVHSNLNSNCALIKEGVCVRSDPNISPAMHGICFNCLESGHLAKSCTLPIRCKNYYNFGHLARWCLTRNRARLV
jgi:hypothetical protein